MEKCNILPLPKGVHVCGNLDLLPRKNFALYKDKPHSPSVLAGKITSLKEVNGKFEAIFDSDRFTLYASLDKEQYDLLFEIIQKEQPVYLSLLDKL